MKIKRLLALLTAVMLLFAAGCGEGNGSSKEQNSSEAALTEKFKGQTLRLYMYAPYPHISMGYENLYAFEEKYGVTLNKEITQYDNLVEGIAKNIAADIQMDLFYCPDTFPAAVNVLQPIENTGIDLDDPIWDKALLRATTVNGKAYLINSIENLESILSVCVYDKSLFEDNNITSPQEYFEKDEWTRENFVNCIKAIDALGEDYVGAAVHKSGAMLLSGDSFYEYNSATGKYTVSATDEIRQAMSFLAGINDQGLIKPTEKVYRNQVVGMTVSTTYDMRFGGLYSINNPENIRAVLLPKKDMESEHIVTAPVAGFGLVEGAKNPELAGFFLKEAFSKDLCYESNIYENDALKDFFYDTYESYSDKVIYFTDQGLLNAAKLDYDFYYKWSELKPDKIEEYIDSQLENMSKVLVKTEDNSKLINYYKKEPIKFD